MPDCSCPRIDVASWQDKVHDWEGRSFFVRRTPLFMHVPFRIGKDITRAVHDLEASQLKLSSPLMVLSRDALFRGEVLLGVDPPAADVTDVQTFPRTTVYSRVFEGQWREIAKPTRQLARDMKRMGKKVEAVYYWYITCSLCASVRGYRTVIFARIA